jgi:hypothetical protein
LQKASHELTVRALNPDSAVPPGAMRRSKPSVAK